MKLWNLLLNCVKVRAQIYYEDFNSITTIKNILGLTFVRIQCSEFIFIRTIFIYSSLSKAYCSMIISYNGFIIIKNLYYDRIIRNMILNCSFNKSPWELVICRDIHLNSRFFSSYRIVNWRYFSLIIYWFYKTICIRDTLVNKLAITVLAKNVFLDIIE